jgi:hypothetical protein
MAPPLRRGDMVWSYFPFAETPDIPARTRLAAITIGAFSATEASRMLGRPVPAYGAAVAVYTSSQFKKFDDDVPIGIIQVPLLPPIAWRKRHGRGARRHRLADLGLSIPTIFITAYPDDAVRARAGGGSRVLPAQAIRRTIFDSMH